MNKLSPLKIQLAIVALAALFFVPFLGIVHLFDWDEVNFAESAREMIVSGDYLTVQINFLPFWEKPPLFIWIQVLSMKIFGINEFAARFPNALCGIITLLVLFNIGRKIKDNQFGILWVLAFAGSVMPFFYFKSGIIDPWFNLFIFLGIYFLILYSYTENNNKIRNIIVSAVFTGLAVLTKGPVSFLLTAVTGFIFLFIVRFKIIIRAKDVIIYIVVFTLVGGLWFLLQILNGHYDTVREFVIYQIRLFKTEDAGHGGFPGFHFIVLLIGVFPTSVLAIKSFKKENLNDPLYAILKKWLVILFWVTLILFTIVRTKIIHYSSLTYFPLSFLAAHFVYQGFQKKQTWSKWQSVMIIVLSVIITLPVIAFQFVDKYKQTLIDNNWIRDALMKNNMQAQIQWSGFEFLLGLIPLILVITILIFIKKEQVIKRAVALWSITIVSAFLIMNVLVPKMEKYTQNALIEFYKSVKDKDAYVKAINFKSYAIYFYGELQPPGNKNYYDDNWLLTGDIDKDTYIVTKTHKADQLSAYKDLEKLYDKNGYTFFIRKSQ